MKLIVMVQNKEERKTTSNWSRVTQFGTLITNQPPCAHKTEKSAGLGLSPPTTCSTDICCCVEKAMGMV